MPRLRKGSSGHFSSCLGGESLCVFAMKELTAQVQNPWIDGFSAARCQRCRRRVLFVWALEIFNGAMFEVPDARTDLFHQVVIVRDQQHRALVFLQGHVKRVDRFQIEVIRRLVEDQDVRLLQHQLAEEQPSRPRRRRAPWSASVLPRR